MQNRKDFLKSLVMGTAGVAALSPLGPARGDYSPDESDADLVAVDEYDFRVRLQVPQVFDNTTSQGYRAYRPQSISGSMFVGWMSDGGFRIYFGKLVNSQFKVQGSRVTYVAEVLSDTVYPRFVYIGNNKTNRFTTPCMCFYAQFQPSYAIGEPEEDNSFYLMFAGRGSSICKGSINARIARRLYGYAAGMQGCSCMDYGHKSPTRNAGISGPTEVVNDVVSSFGTWHAAWKNRTLA